MVVSLPPLNFSWKLRHFVEISQSGNMKHLYKCSVGHEESWRTPRSKTCFFHMSRYIQVFFSATTRSVEKWLGFGVRLSPKSCKVLLIRWSRSWRTSVQNAGVLGERWAETPTMEVYCSLIRKWPNGFASLDVCWHTTSIHCLHFLLFKT